MVIGDSIEDYLLLKQAPGPAGYSRGGGSGTPMVNWVPHARDRVLGVMHKPRSH